MKRKENPKINKINKITNKPPKLTLGFRVVPNCYSNNYKMWNMPKKKKERS
jgi:hypothetical protein